MKEEKKKLNYPISSKYAFSAIIMKIFIDKTFSLGI